MKSNPSIGYTRGMKTAISMPDPLFAQVDAEAKKLGVSRSRLVQNVFEAYFKSRRDADIRAAVDRYVAEHRDLTEEDEIVLAHGREMLRRVEWDE